MTDISSVVGGKKGVCSHSPEEKPSKISFKLENAGDVPYFTKTWSDDDLPIDILLLAVESRDFLSCFSLQDQLLKIYKSELGYVYFGNMGDAKDQEKVKLALLNCSIGATTPGGSLTVVRNAVTVLRPKALFSMGTFKLGQGQNGRRSHIFDAKLHRDSKLLSADFLAVLFEAHRKGGLLR